MTEDEFHAADHAPKLLGLFWIVLILGVAGGFALGLGPLARAVPWEWEESLAGVLNPDSLACGPSDRQKELMDKLVGRLWPLDDADRAIKISVTAVNDPSVNAYAMLGGDISVNAGLLRKAGSADELAGVIAHEIGHVQRRHILRSVIARLFTAQGLQIIFTGDARSADMAGFFLHLRFSRAQEAEADEKGFERLQAAHVDNRGFRAFFERQEESASAAFLSDHPPNEARAEMAQSFSNKDARPILTAAEWTELKKYCDRPSGKH
jgi:predicted Zn-dependent protease